MKKTDPENMYVASGNVILGTQNSVLVSTPLGSCIALIFYDKILKTGGMAHIMLPGKSPKNKKTEKYKYAEDAIQSLLTQLYFKKSKKKNLLCFLIGGANVLQKKDDKLVKLIVSDVKARIQQREIQVLKESLGGFERRTAVLNLSQKKISVSIGNENQKVFFNFTSIYQK
jgi:chemotaxis protein CheD